MIAFLRLINPQGIVGIVVALALGTLLFLQKGETRHWKTEASAFEISFKTEQAAHRETQLNYHRAAEAARKADAENKARVEREQRAVTERIERDYQARLADARTRAERLRHDLEARANPGGPGTAPVPSLRDAPGGPDAFSLEDRLLATEQAIQLDELIKWVRGQVGVEVSGHADAQ